MAAILAISSAFLFGLAHIATQLGLRYAHVLPAVLVSLLSCVFFSFILCIFSFSLSLFLNTAVLFFLGAGILGPFLGRFFLYEGIDRVGISIASTLYETKPLFSLIAAVLVLGEEVTAPIFWGMVCMMIGTAIVSAEKTGGSVEKTWTKKDLVFPLIAGAFYGLSHILRKMGLNLLVAPMVGVLAQNVGALASVPLLAWTQRKPQRMFADRKKAWLLFSLAGLLQVAAQWCFLKALELGTVVVVSPLSSLSTFFVLIMAALFLRGIEKVTWKIVLGAVLIIGATFMLSWLS